MAEDHQSFPARKPHQSMEKRRNSCEARPGLIESTHIAPLNEGLMAEDHMRKMDAGMAGMGMKDMPKAMGHGDSAAVHESFMRHSLR